MKKNITLIEIKRQANTLCPWDKTMVQFGLNGARAAADVKRVDSHKSVISRHRVASSYPHRNKCDKCQEYILRTVRILYYFIVSQLPNNYSASMVNGVRLFDL